MALSSLEPRSHPVFTVVTFCAQSGLFQQNIQSVLVAIMPCLHHTMTRVLREFHTPQRTTVYFKRSPVPQASLMAWQQN